MTILTRLSAPPVAPSITSPALYIETGAWAKILSYARLSGKLEINGFGYLFYDDDGDYHLTGAEDVFITKQEVSAGAAEVAAGNFAMAVSQAMEDDRSDDLRFQWHSHVTGAAIFSGIDTANIKGYGEAGMEYFVSLVMNQHGELSARLDVFRPVRAAVALDVYLYDSSVSTEELQADIDDNVTEKIFLPAVRFVPPKKPSTGRRSRGGSKQQAEDVVEADAPELVSAK